MNTLRLVIEICLLRGRAQDLPAGMPYVWFAGAASAGVDILSLSIEGTGFGAVLFVALEILLFGAALRALLTLRGVPERWMQTVTALYATNAVFSLLLLPFVSTLVEFSKQFQQGANPVAGPAIYVAMLLSGWFLAVMTRVLREATGWSIGLSLAATFACVAFVRITGAILASVLGLQVGV